MRVTGFPHYNWKVLFVSLLWFWKLKGFIDIKSCFPVKHVIYYCNVLICDVTLIKHVKFNVTGIQEYDNFLCPGEVF